MSTTHRPRFSTSHRAMVRVRSPQRDDQELTWYAAADDMGGEAEDWEPAIELTVSERRTLPRAE